MSYKSLFDLLKKYDTEEKCRDFFADCRWHGKVVCPHCGNAGEKKITKIERGVYKGGFKCFSCRKRFSIRTNTFMGESLIKFQKWLMAIFLLTSHKKGLSSLQLAKDIGVSQKTAWFMIQRILNIVGSEDIKLGGVVEVDETYVGGKESNKHRDRRTMNFDKGAGDKTAILGMIERGGNVVLKKFDKVNKANILPHIEHHIAENAIINTDESSIYKGALSGRERRIVNHNAGQYSFGENTTNRVEGMFSHLKRMVNGIHIWLSKKHMQKYTDLFCFRMNTRALNEYERIAALLTRTDNSRIMWKEVVAIGAYDTKEENHCGDTR